jgi:RNA polymerase sigma factor (sigma-70 family)
MCACAAIPNSQGRLPIWSILGEETGVLNKLDEFSVHDQQLDADANAKIQEAKVDREKLFRQLVSEYQGRLYRYVIKHIGHPDDAADITQQAFSEAARTLSTFRGDSELSTWLFGIAMNMIRNYLNRAPHRVHKFEGEEALSDFMAPTSDPVDCAANKQLIAMVATAISELPQEMSEVLLLVAVDDVSYEDAAEILCIPVGTVRSRVSRARACLRARFGNDAIISHFREE